MSVPGSSPSWCAVFFIRCTNKVSEFFVSSCELGSAVGQQPVDARPITEEARPHVVTPSTQPCACSQRVPLKLDWRVGDPPDPWVFCFCSHNHF